MSQEHVRNEYDEKLAAHIAVCEYQCRSLRLLTGGLRIFDMCPSGWQLMRLSVETSDHLLKEKK